MHGYFVQNACLIIKTYFCIDYKRIHLTMYRGRETVTVEENKWATSLEPVFQGLRPGKLKPACLATGDR